jgi:8-oxo-dGTP pyrophosphatase MutT (NUDIX family)
MANLKKRRGTIILENENGILLARTGSDNLLMLPGGHAEHNEPRIIAAIRELHEETKLRAFDVKFLFDFESKNYFHKVFLIKAHGEPIPSREISSVDYYHPEKTNIYNSSIEIIQKYLAMKDQL